MAASTPLIIPRKSQASILEFAKSAYQSLGSQWDLRTRMREIDLAYMREQDTSKEHSQAKAANKVGDKTKFQNITVPVVLPQVEAAVTYQSSVFLTGTPIFGVVSNPQNIDAALQMETVIEDQATRGGWVRELMLFFRDGFKYNLSAIEVPWKRQVTAAIETDVSFSATQGKPVETIWEGNALKRLDPYNLIFDTRVNPTEVASCGEFAGYTEMMSRIALKRFIGELPDKMVDNVVTAFESGLGGGGIETYYVPTLNAAAMLQKNSKGFNWLNWANLSGTDRKIAYQDCYEVTTLYGLILPSDHGLRVPASNTPQVWKFIIINNQVLIYAERQTNAHNLIPILFGQPLEDGLGYQTKSLAQNAQPFQDITSAMWNSVIDARRRAISDRGIYDPSRIAPEHINNPNPAAKIPVRPSAYGKPVQDSYFPIPFRDDQSTLIMQETDQVLRMADKVSGQNPVKQGQFVKGNKTRKEFSDVMGNANGRDQMTAMLYEAQVFTPLKHIVKTNILQYQGGVSLYNRQKEREVKIDPVQLRKAVMEFKVSDGLTPADKLVDTDALQVSLQVLGSSPEIAAGYNVAPLFSYLMKTQGAKIAEFEKSPEQLAYEQALRAWQQAMSGMQEQMQGMMKGVDPAMVPQMMEQFQKSMPPMPTPEQYGYQPANMMASPVTSQQPEVATRINNITNNITNQGQ